MSNVLDSIVNYKRLVVANSSDVLPSENSTRSFKNALTKSDFGFIMECKKASPSKGLIRSDFNLIEISQVYDRYADAISVLTEDRFFQGSYRNLEFVSKNTNKPVLCKDFILEPKQIRQARYYGADAVLLMLSVLSDHEYELCATEAKKYNMDVLTEVHDETEVERAIKLGSEIIGINNRNLKDLSTCLSNTKQLSKLIPSDRVIVTESGINSHQDIISLSAFADACLVGSSLMLQDDLEKATAQLVYGDIKICGLTRNEDFELLEQSSASLLGVIFAENSKRKLPENTKIYGKNKPLIGVFQNQSADYILSKIGQHKLTGIQLHGDEPQETINQLRKALGEDFFISKVVHVNGEIPSFDYKNVDELLLDSQVFTQQGGTGEVFDWGLLDDEKITSNLEHIRIAGGLNSANIQQLKKLGFYKLDIGSGSEIEPGVKCPIKINEIFNSSKVKGIQR